MYRSSPPFRSYLLALASGALMLAACSQKMTEQPSLRPLQPDAARPLPADTVARGQLRDNVALFTGQVGGQNVDQFPVPVTRDLIERGQQRFNIYCLPCHGYLGEGDGMVVQRGFSPPPTFHSDRLRQAPVGYLFNVITNGFGAMPSYAGQVPVPDRWAIVAYIRALQLSQNATLDDVPAADRARLEQAP